MCVVGGLKLGLVGVGWVKDWESMDVNGGRAGERAEVWWRVVFWVGGTLMDIKILLEKLKCKPATEI